MLLRDPARARREIPVLAMLDQPEEVLAARASRLRDGIGEVAEVVRSVGRVGGGALPLTELEGPAVALAAGADPVALLASLRTHDPPVIARIHDGQVVLDARTIADDEVETVVGGGPRRAGPRMSAAPLTLGTAGHIDHGKSALIRALTGVDTDRLPEEHARGISIELGYARLELPSGRSLSIVDVPGHERYVRTMVAGATGIDLYLMAIAADDGVMPQTREHAAVLRALGRATGCGGGDQVRFGGSGAGHARGRRAAARGGAGGGVVANRGGAGRAAGGDRPGGGGGCEPRCRGARWRGWRGRPAAHRSRVHDQGGGNGGHRDSVVR